MSLIQNAVIDCSFMDEITKILWRKSILENLLKIWRAINGTKRGLTVRKR